MLLHRVSELIFCVSFCWLLSRYAAPIGGMVGESERI
jgi:hypothetical protein